METQTLTAPAPADKSTYSRVFDLLPHFVSRYNSDDALVSKVNGKWEKIPAATFIETANRISLGLIKLGIRKDDKIAIISPNRPEWNFVDFGVQQLGAVSVPLYPTITIEDYRYILRDSEAKLVFVANTDLLAKVKEAITEVEGVEGVYTFDRIPGVPHWSEVADLGKDEDPSQLESYKAAVSEEDLLTLIYTSGTTGVPKGVMLTHHNLLSNVEAVKDYIPIGPGEKALSFLPLCHVYERMIVYMYMRYGVSIYYAESMDTIAENLKEVKPTVFTTVPRLLEKVYDKIVAKGYELSGIKKQLFFWALNLGLRYDPVQDMGFFYNIQLKLARKLIFSKWQEALGGNIRLIVTGSAALQPRLARVFWAAGIPVTEGYGLTETSPVISVGKVMPPDLRVGCVGTIIPDVHVKIAEDGEILVKGPNIMKGYYRKPEQTAEAIDKDGWFHTGDIGEMVEGRFLKITDRKKEMFKTSGGKYVAPQMVENKLKESKYIEQVIVVGEGQKFPSALIIPEFGALKVFCQLNNLDPTMTPEQMVKNEQIVAKIEQEIERLNASFAKYEQVKKFRLLATPFTIEAGELTPTLKLKRKAILKRYQSVIEGIYQ
ncbi:AMP-dependent synthetase/ligase [Siphonobacter aquaeclarae]|uniref:Long-chain acyl-CoA synthetase n=1 Tax=Siphonobacter aquaeclarae TaxID=563176 RepID=A0A1G9M9D7_9BACT|nr:long-chain fatty acid--CoA ligase [Siphonobacter aquaeclarae]SDL70819.1 long-chain acyl-CoA synthetase [Siphonobacter aquaeclarae]